MEHCLFHLQSWPDCGHGIGVLDGEVVLVDIVDVVPDIVDDVEVEIGIWFTLAQQRMEYLESLSLTHTEDSALLPSNTRPSPNVVM